MVDTPDDTDTARTTEFLALGAATIGESGGKPMAPRVKAVWPGAAVAGPAFPVRCAPGDNLAIHVAVATAPRGSVLAVDVGDEEAFGYWGEVLTTGAETRGIAGLVIDGGVRDSAALALHGFPVFSTAVALRGASKNRPGTVGAPVEVGGVSVAAGDWLVADADGVVVVGAETISDVLSAGRARVDKEEAMFRALRQGSTTVELLGLDASPVQKT